jgi:hypothetical protein
LNDDKEEPKFEVRFHSDGTYSIVTKIDTEAEVLKAALKAEEIKKLIGLSDCIKKIRKSCTSKNKILIFPKHKGVSDEIRLVACSAAAYPDGFPQDAISTELGIADTSRDAYLNWETKESSKYLTYDSSTKKVYVNPAGIDWICNELKQRKVSGFEEVA